MWLSVPEAPAVIEAAGEEAVVQQSVEQVPDLVVEYVSELPPEPAAEAATEGGHDEGPPEKASEESVEAVVTVEVESSPNESDVVNATPEEEATVQQSVESVPDLVAESVSKLPPQLAAPAKGSHDKDPPEQAVVETVETITEVNVASVPEAPAVIEAAGEEAVVQQSVEQVPDLVVESVSELPPEPAAEAATEGSHDKGPPEQAAKEAVNPETEVNVASSPAVTDAAGDDTAVQDSVEQIPDLVVESESELPPQPAVETAAIYAASTEPVLQTRAEEVVECEVQPANNTVVEQSIELPHESTPGRKVEPCIEDALEPTTAPEAEAAQEFTYRAIELTDALDVKPPAPEDEAAQEFTYRAIELTEALDVEPPPPEAADEPLKSPEQSHTEEMTPAIFDMLQTPVEEPPSREILYETRESISVCSVCDKIIGNIKISFSEPPVIYHPECLKCGVCDKALGDMLTPMFLHNQVIQCDGCFAKTHKTSSLTGTNMSSETTQSIL
ncbi:hypothetical protein D5F01_LYC13911 [Larimichthys crocea]|uniref:LIM zinc-binding domain-containing protein n=1 Tax=Larimichthys crocea TaxID=215358 RepID=A0A6G0I8U5_LARCR|nr:hypothetical protein D5F01_LYC13911 [Larimichthys crocea]